MKHIGLTLMLACSPAMAIPPLYAEIAVREGIPPKVLYSIALTESQKRLDNGNVRPWPWTLNVQGKGYYFDSEQQACQALTRWLSVTNNIDIGLTQQNWRWQGEHFSSPCEVLNPHINLSHAARLLKSGYERRGNWLDAAGWYHRPAGGKPAQQYQSRFTAIYRGVSHAY